MAVLTSEVVLDKVAQEIIEHSSYNVTPQLLEDTQKFVRDGVIKIGGGGKLLIYQKDSEANKEDLVYKNANGETLDNIITKFVNAGVTAEQILVSINLAAGNPPDGTYGIYLLDTAGNNFVEDLTDIVSSPEASEDGSVEFNPHNLSQFLNISQQTTVVSKDKANEYLDTNIYELLPTGESRQDRITAAFTELKNLLPPRIEDADFDSNGDDRVDRVTDQSSDNYGDWIGSENYYLQNEISAPQNNEPNSGLEDTGFITRLDKNASTQNADSGQTIESLRRLLDTYLVDVDEEPISPQDDRPVYRNESSGYLKFRNLNQGIIIRNTNQDFVEGLNPDTRDYLTTGFTITMWVRFLDKVSEGTLFNFGNPMKENNPFGFKLDTFVLSPDTPTANGPGNPLSSLSGYGPMTDENFSNFDNPNGPLFRDTDTERFVRLVVYDNNDNKLYGSHTCNAHSAKHPSGAGDNEIPDINVDDGSGILNILNNVRVPQDYSEWYFICATYNPNISEHSFDNGLHYEDNKFNYNFWMNNFDPVNEVMVAKSGFGNKCKVEIISRSDLLRARGFKVD